MPAKKKSPTSQPSLPLGDDSPPKAARYSVFSESGFKPAIAALCDAIRELYLADPVPWIIGYSGGKDSTAVLQLIWMAISELPLVERKKIIHVISTDTLVENPVVSAWVRTSLERMAAEANKQMRAHRINRFTGPMTKYPSSAASFATGCPRAGGRLPLPFH